MDTKASLSLARDNVKSLKSQVRVAQDAVKALRLTLTNERAESKAAKAANKVAKAASKVAARAAKIAKLEAKLDALRLAAGSPKARARAKRKAGKVVVLVADGKAVTA